MMLGSAAQQCMGDIVEAYPQQTTHSHGERLRNLQHAADRAGALQRLTPGVVAICAFAPGHEQWQSKSCCGRHMQISDVRSHKFRLVVVGNVRS